MNTRNRNGFRGFGFYAVLILVVIMIWYGLSGNTATSSYTKSDFQKALGKGDVTYVKVVQNREVPTGSLRIKLKDGSQQYLYASDINEMQSLMDDEKFDNYTIEDVPAESWIMTLLPYLLIFGAFFMATDYVTSPITPMGQIVFGIMLGLLTGIFRLWGASPEGVSYAIILCNLFVPMIERVTLPKAFGKEAKKA